MKLGDIYPTDRTVYFKQETGRELNAEKGNAGQRDVSIQRAEILARTSDFL